MSIQRPLLCLVLPFLFLTTAFASLKDNPAYADTLSASEPVQIAQATEEPQPKPKEGEGELGEDDC